MNIHKNMMCFILLIAGLHGCTVTTSFFVEKDWQTERRFTSPDMKTTLKIETAKEF